MRLIDADLLDITEITTDDYSGNEVLDVVLKKDIDNEPTVKAIPIEVVEQIRAEITELTKCPYKECVGTDDCPFQDCMIHGKHVIEIIDKALEEQD